MFDPQFMQQPAMFQQQFQSFAQAGAFTQPTSTSTTSTANNTPTSTTWSETTTGSPKDNEDRGWIKESKVTKVTPQGTRETTIKKTAADVSVSCRLISKAALVALVVIRVGVSGFAWYCSGEMPELPPRPSLSTSSPSGGHQGGAS